MKRKWFLLSFILFIFLTAKNVFACDACSCSIVRDSSEHAIFNTGQKIFFDFTTEQQVWHKRDPQLAHELHDDGHDSHDKTREEFYHFILGFNPMDRITLLADLPYIVRHALEVEDHDHLGERQRSEGLGDLKLVGVYRIFKKEENFLGPLVGVKFPTGQTNEKSKQGERFEPEIQPGSGSFDTTIGGSFQYAFKPVVLHGNVTYTIKTKGSQDFEFGDVFSSYLYADYLFNPKARYFHTRVGIDTNFLWEQKQKNQGEKVADSGGFTWLLGPEISIQGNKNISIFGNILFPVVQNLGGIHQHLQMIWNAGVRIGF